MYFHYSFMCRFYSFWAWEFIQIVNSAFEQQSVGRYVRIRITSESIWILWIFISLTLDTIPSELGKLCKLLTLRLNSNCLEGMWNYILWTMELWGASCFHLYSEIHFIYSVLLYFACKFSIQGTIPSVFSYFSSISYLQLNINKLQGIVLEM